MSDIVESNYEATLVKVVDGDTLDVLVKLPLGVLKQERIRLLDVNAPEMSTPEGVVAYTFVTSVLLPNTPIQLITKEKRDRYGRLLSYVECNKQNISKLLLDKGYAAKYSK